MPGGVPLDDLALIRMEEDTPHFDVFSKDSAQLLFPFDQHKIEIPDLIELGEIAWALGTRRPGVQGSQPRSLNA